MSKVFAGMLILFSSAAFAFDCDKEIAKLESCDPSSNFIDLYLMICLRGNNLPSAHISEIFKAMEAEINNNPCLQKKYRQPRYQRPERDMQKIREEMKEAE